MKELSGSMEHHSLVKSFPLKNRIESSTGCNGTGILPGIKRLLKNVALSFTMSVSQVLGNMQKTARPLFC